MRGCVTFTLFTKVRRHNLCQDDDYDDLLHFVVDLMMDPKKLKGQVFVNGHKRRHNMICKWSLPRVKTYANLAI